MTTGNVATSLVTKQLTIKVPIDQPFDQTFKSNYKYINFDKMILNKGSVYMTRALLSVITKTNTFMSKISKLKIAIYYVKNISSAVLEDAGLLSKTNIIMTIDRTKIRRVSKGQCEILIHIKYHLYLQYLLMVVKTKHYYTENTTNINIFKY